MKKFFCALFCLLLLVGCASRKGEAADYGVNYEDYGGNYVVGDSYTKTEESKNAREEKIVYTGDIAFESRQYDDFTAELNRIIASFGGISQSLRESGSGRRVMYLTVRIPADRFDDFINALRSSSGSVVNVSVYSDNITKQYNDTVIEIEALNTQHQRLLQLLEKAETLSDIIALEDRLTDVETRLTKLENYRNEMDGKVAYSTITITVSEVVSYTESTFLERVQDAIVGSLKQFVDDLQYLIIRIIYLIPTLIVLAVMALLLKKPAVRLYGRIKESRNRKAVENSSSENKE